MGDDKKEKIVWTSEMVQLPIKYEDLIVNSQNPYFKKSETIDTCNSSFGEERMRAFLGIDGQIVS